MSHRNKNNYLHVIVGVFTLVGIVLATFSIFFVYKAYYIHKEMSPVVESPKTDVKKIPPEVKQQLSLITPSATLRVPILMYHYVEYVRDTRDTIRQSLNVNPNIFESQIKTLLDAGYTFLEAKDLGDILDGKKTLPEKPVLITVDDGHWDVDTVILPILKKYNVKATAYVIPGFTGGSDFMTQEQVQDIITSGLIEVGAHTVHHIALKGKSSKIVTYEVQESKKMLEDVYHIPVSSFAYPAGSFDLQAIQAVKDAGFSIAVSTIPGVDLSQANRYFLYRLRPGRRTGQILLSFLQKAKF